MQLIDRDIPGPKRAFVGYGRQLPKVFWPHDAKVAVNLVVNYEEGSEYSKPAGDDRNEGLAEISYSLDSKHRDLCVESVYEYGSRAGVWRLMRLFDEYQVKVTFFACAVALERTPRSGSGSGRVATNPAPTAGGGASTGGSAARKNNSRCSGPSSPSERAAGSVRWGGIAATAPASTRGN
jgi:hypothetical protein